MDRKQSVDVSVGLHIITFSLHNKGKEIVAQGRWLGLTLAFVHDNFERATTNSLGAKK